MMCKLLNIRVIQGKVHQDPKFYVHEGAAAYQSPMAHEGATKGSKSKYLSCEIRNILHNTTFERCVTFNP
jgi:hypothetical protein